MLYVTRARVNGTIVLVLANRKSGTLLAKAYAFALMAIAIIKAKQMRMNSMLFSYALLNMLYLQRMPVNSTKMPLLQEIGPMPSHAAGHRNAPVTLTSGFSRA